MDLPPAEQPMVLRWHVQAAVIKAAHVGVVIAFWIHTYLEKLAVSKGRCSRLDFRCTLGAEMVKHRLHAMKGWV